MIRLKAMKIIEWCGQPLVESYSITTWKEGEREVFTSRPKKIGQRLLSGPGQSEPKRMRLALSY